MTGMTPTSVLSGWIRAPRWLALRMVSAVILAATVAAFTESYRGLYEWAVRHGMTGFWAAVWPLQVDTFIVVGELMLFVAVADRWPWRRSVVAWVATAIGVSESVAGNVGHAATHDLATRLTFAVPPLAAAGAMFLGLLILKAAIAALPAPAAPATVTAREVAIARSGERAYAAAMSAAARSREADTKRAEADRKRREKADTDRSPKRPRRPAGDRRKRPVVIAKHAAIEALIAQPNMSAADLTQRYGATARTARRWRAEARELAAAANGHSVAN